MTEYQIYAMALVTCGLFSLLVAFWAVKMSPEKLSKWESLPRDRNVAALLVLLCLLWCVPQAKPIVWDWALPWLYPMAVAFSILGFLYLDYLFARAIGGLFILVTYYFVHEGFTFHTPWLAFFALMCWALGILGLFFSGKPHLCRDFIRKLAKSSCLRYTTLSYFAAFGVLCLTLGVIHICRG